MKVYLAFPLYGFNHRFPKVMLSLLVMVVVVVLALSQPTYVEKLNCRQLMLIVLTKRAKGRDDIEFTWSVLLLLMMGQPVKINPS